MKTMVIVIATLISAMASAETFKVDAQESKVEWAAGKKVGAGHNGTIQIKNGEVQTDAKGQVTSAQVVVDMKTIANNDLKDNAEYQKKLVGHLSSDDFFKVDKFAESTFKLSSIKAKAGSKDEYVVKGELTMIGKTQPVEFPAKMTVNGSTLSGSGKITIERLKWGLQYGSGSIFKTLTADKIINDTFDITLNIVAKK